MKLYQFPIQICGARNFELVAHLWIIATKSYEPQEKKVNFLTSLLLKASWTSHNYVPMTGIIIIPQPNGYSFSAAS